MVRNLGFFLIFTLFISCVDHQFINNDVIIIRVKPDPLKGLPDAGPVRFDNPAIGQRSYYVLLKASVNGATHEVVYEYGPDTLVIAITGKNASQWIMKDFLTPGSYSIQTDKGTFSFDSVFVTLLEINADSIAFTRPANDIYSTYFFIFSYDGRLAFPLALVSEPSQQNPDCSPYFYLDHEPMAYALNYTQLGQTFDHLNVYMDYSEIATDGAGLMYIYGPSSGFVRMTAYNPWGNNALGWDLIPR
jgi:hypothetical protein